MSDHGEIRSQSSLSDNDSDPASTDSRISDDSGIEDWGEDMAIQTEQSDVNVTQSPKDEKPSSPKQLNSPNSLKEEASLTECIYPMLPENSTGPELPERKDLLDESAIKGVCGLYNIGNTCFMNAVLQSMIATQAIQRLVLQGDILQNGTDHMNEPSVVLLFIERFQELLQKVFSGGYSLLYPDQFHAAVRRLHSSFGDYKQHDSQEFLSFILNTLHDLLNHASTHNKNRQILSSTTDNAAACLSCKDLLSDNMMLEVSKKLKMDSSFDEQAVMETEADAGVECEDNVLKYEKAWREHICNNQSIIADTFQGQFQSLITCDKCLFVSTTYEPFMFLSLPIPHAMEKQIVVTWVPSMSQCSLPGMLAVKKYLVVVSKNGCVSDVKKNFFEMLKKEDESIVCNNIVLAEVFNCASVKILDDRTQLNYLSKSKDVYAIEMLSMKTNVSSDTDQMQDNSAISAWHSCCICFEEVFDEQLTVHSVCGGFICKECLKRAAEFHNGKQFQCPTCSCFISHDDYKPLLDEKSKDNPCTSEDVPSQTDIVPSSSLCDGASTGLSSASSWHSCTVCLEETFDEDLKVHPTCGAFLCSGCLKRTVEFHKKDCFPCAVCDRHINAGDYVSYVSPSKMVDKLKPELRQVLVPIMFRHSSSTDTTSTTSTTKKYHVFGHPTICSLLSEVASTTVFELVDRIVAVVSSYAPSFDIIVSDGTGLSCGRCEMFSSCHGCPVKAPDVIKLRPGICITVHFHDKLDVVVRILNLYHSDESMNWFRDGDTVSLDECMEKFGDTEVLSDDNPWYCPQCQCPQISTKTMAITKWPDVLIIHLKRFYFEGNQGCKITCPVSYPLKELNVELLTCADVSESTKTCYDLYSVVCHTGTLFGGHYTAFTKGVTPKWYFFNDESYQEMTPSEEHQRESYMLFYQRSSTKQVAGDDRDCLHQ